MNLRKREFRNLKTSWIDVGLETGPLLVFLHGFPDSAETWKNQIEFFQAKYRVICPFTRGSYPSDAAERIERYSTRCEALDILQLLQTIDPKHERRVYLVGHDLGSPVAWKLASLLSHRLAGLVILNGLSLGQMSLRLRQRPLQWLKSWYVFPMLVPLLPEFAFGHFAKPLLKIARESGGFPGTTESEDAYAQKNILQPLNQYRAFVRETIKFRNEEIAKIHNPTLVLWSNGDKYLLHPTMEELEPFASNVTVRILDGHHWIHFANPDLVNGVLQDFFEANK